MANPINVPDFTTKANSSYNCLEKWLASILPIIFLMVYILGLDGMNEI
jgi:hypothetical protein